MNLRPEETELIGQWIVVNGKVEGDETCNRIDNLIDGSSPSFRRVLNREGEFAAREGGWTSLFQDLDDNRYWEVSRPHSEWHGGGPHTLTHVTVDFVRSNYDLDI